MMRLALCLVALLAAGGARAQFVPDVPPFTPADPLMGRPVDRIQRGPWGDPSLSRQGPLAQPHPAFRDPLDGIYQPQPVPAPGAGTLPMGLRIAPGGSPRLGDRDEAPSRRGPILLTQRKDAGGMRGDGLLRRPSEVGAQLAECWSPPSAGAEATIRVVFSRSGQVVGAPRVTYVRSASPQNRDEVRASALAAVRACAPLRLAPALASAIAGRIFAIRLIASN